jgi:hypothetical protein
MDFQVIGGPQTTRSAFESLLTRSYLPKAFPPEEPSEARELRSNRRIDESDFHPSKHGAEDGTPR